MFDLTVLKENQLCLVTDPQGDIVAGSTSGQGLYFQDTRFLSIYELRIQHTRPDLLSAAGEFNFMTNLQFSNEPLRLDDGSSVPSRTLSIRRNRFLHHGLHERIGFFNYNATPIELAIQLTFGSDFRDMFDVRGYALPPERGRILPPEIQGRLIRLAYLGLDGVRRETLITSEVEPSAVVLLRREAEILDPVTLPGLSGKGEPRKDVPIRPPAVEATFRLLLPTGEPRWLTFSTRPAVAGEVYGGASAGDLETAFVSIRESYERWEGEATQFSTDNDIVNAVLHRAIHDLRLLTDDLPRGLVPSAGIPWFSAPFGRDSLITSLQTLSLQPRIAYGTLRFLAENQGERVDDWRDEEPGKILHEVRMGELAALGRVPHARYFGSVDATPLFLVALGGLLDWTDDWEFARQMEPHVHAALEWIDHYGDLDGDGFVEYRSRSERGIRNQGWKDSPAAIAHLDGRAAEPPIALVEVQGYVYDAKRRMSAYYERLGDARRAARLKDEAERLRQAFEDRFWVAEGEFYALALDAEKRQVAQVSSNQGHCLWSGIVDPARAGMVGQRLTSEPVLSGWGVRTLALGSPGFNPMSYHNGSVWPHDSALASAGLKRYGMGDQATRVASQVLDAATRMPLYRLPELYCGFGRDRRYFTMPALYPVSCSPQAWAAGSVFHFIQTLLGLTPDLPGRRLVVDPLLPEQLGELRVRRLRVGSSSVDLNVRRDGVRSVVEVLRGDGLDVEVRDPSAARVSRV